MDSARPALAAGEAAVAEETERARAESARVWTFRERSNRSEDWVSMLPEPTQTFHAVGTRNCDMTPHAFSRVPMHIIRGSALT